MAITPLDDQLLEAFDAPDGLRAGLMAVYLIGFEHGAGSR